MTVYSHPNVSRVPGVFTKLILGEFPPKMPTLWVFLLTTKNGFTALVIAADADEARRTALMHDPRGRWDTATSDQVAECCPTRPRRVLAMEMLR